MNNEKTIFETGASSAAVNELILYTDNTKELAELRDEIYEVIAEKKYIAAGHHFPELLAEAIARYKKELPHSDSIGSIKNIKNWDAQGKEYCQIYANRFPEWKKERDRNPVK